MIIDSKTVTRTVNIVANIEETGRGMAPWGYLRIPLRSGGAFDAQGGGDRQVRYFGSQHVSLAENLRRGPAGVTEFYVVAIADWSRAQLAAHGVSTGMATVKLTEETIETREV